MMQHMLNRRPKVTAASSPDLNTWLGSGRTVEMLSSMVCTSQHTHKRDQGMCCKGPAVTP